MEGKSGIPPVYAGRRTRQPGEDENRDCGVTRARAGPLGVLDCMLLH